jgi:iron complex transport system substrate-binding protein
VKRNHFAGRRLTTKGFFLLLAALALLVVACGAETDSAALTGDLSGGEAEPDAEASDGDVMEADDNADQDLAEQSEQDAPSELPDRIVSISSSSTEILFAIGAGDQVVAVDSFSNYPESVPSTDLSAFEPNLEAIAAVNPDLVVMSFDPGEIVAGFEKIGVPVILHEAAATIDDVFAQIADLGVVTGHEDEAAMLVANIRDGLSEIVDAQPDRERSVRIYHELDDTFYSASSNSFIGQLYGLLGVENIADEADTDGFGFPQLSPEYLIESDPELIVITDQVGYDVDDVAARPGWHVISAVQNGKVIQVDADVASRWGPRIVEFLQVISDAVALETAGG